MRILGIDPGSRITGWGVIQWPAAYIGCGIIKLPDVPLNQRLPIIFKDIQSIIKKYQPDCASIEEVFLHKNPQSALKLGHARGAAMIAVSLSDIPLYEYAPRFIKQTITGYGNADKIQMQTMIQSILNLNAKPSSDAADALSMAICHGYCQKTTI